jgi:two-component system response regulator PilR (NtrC family)
MAIKRMVKIFEGTAVQIERDYKDWIKNFTNIKVVERLIAVLPSGNDIKQILYIFFEVFEKSKTEPEQFELVLPDEGIDLLNTLDDIEKNLLKQAIEKTNGVREKAAELLGLSFRSFRYRLDKHGMD